MTELGTDTRVKLILPALESPRSTRRFNSFGHRVTKWAWRRLGMTHGPWQEYALDRILEHDDDMNLIARKALISVGRQNGKSVIIRSLVGWLLDEGYKYETFAGWNFVLLAAHDAKQARIPYNFIRQDVELYADISGRWNARLRGSERGRATLYGGIELNGISVDVASRHAGAQRGISPGLICFDEVLTQTDFRMYEVLSPAQSAVANSQMVMTSTAGFSDSVVLRQFHDLLYRQSTGAEQHDETFCGLWWRADDDDVGLDWDQLKLANPALDDGRLSRDMIRAEYGILPKGSWIRERLNRWHDERVDAPFSLKAWGMCRQREPLHPSVVAADYTIAVDVASTWSEGSIIVAAQRDDGAVGVEVHRYLQSRPDNPLTAEDFTSEIIKVARRYQVEQIVYSYSSALAPAMERIAIQESLPCIAVNNQRMQIACHDFAEAVVSRRIAHDDPHLDSQISMAQRRFVGLDGSWRWAISIVPITSVVGATLATMFAAKALKPVQLFL